MWNDIFNLILRMWCEMKYLILRKCESLCLLQNDAANMIGGCGSKFVSTSKRRSVRGYDGMMLGVYDELLSQIDWMCPKLYRAKSAIMTSINNKFAKFEY